MTQESEPTFVFKKFETRYRIDRNQMEFACRIIPQDRFVKYEPKDLEWMIPLGMAPRIEDVSPYKEAFQRIADRLAAQQKRRFGGWR